MGVLASRNLVAGYDKLPVLDDVTLDFAPGTMTALVGPNGCGKSTYLSVLARILAPRAGSAVLDGRAIHRMPTREVARRLGLLPQNPNAPESITVYDLVSRGRYPHQGVFRQWTAVDEAAVETALRLTDTEHLADRHVDTLSGGQRQRAWLALTLAQEAATILLDEPTTFLDLRYQVEILELLHRLTRELGRTIVVVLHELNLTAAFADNLVMMREGRIHAAGPTADTFTADNVESVFGIPVHVAQHPETGRPWCLPRQRALLQPAAS